MTKRHFTLVALLILLLGWRAEAQFTPQGFSYQCIVRDDNGASLNNQTVSILFTIRSGAPNGPVAYSEMQTSSTNEFGLVNLVIGQGSPLQGTFTNINWGGSAKYLTVSVETAPNVFDELGTTQLMSVPYALHAQNATNGSDNWGSQTVQSSSELDGDGTNGNPLTIAQQGAQAGQVLKWDGSTWVPQDDETGEDGTVTEINTGTGLKGGPITTSGTISLAATTVAAGLYGSATQIPVLTVDEYGRVTDVFTVTPQPPSVGITGASGISVSQNGLNFTITNTGDTDATDDITTASQADGDVSGPFSNLQIKPGVVGTPELSDAAVTAAKINSMGATSGQVLKWTGTTWAPAADALGVVNIAGGTGINVTGGSNNFTVENTGDTDPSDDLTINSVANGDITGLFSNLQIKPDVVSATELTSNAVTTVKIASQAVTGEKIAQMSAANGQVLKWNGTTWAPAPDNLGTVTITGGIGIDVIAAGNNYTIANNGDINPFDDITQTSTAGGDISGTFDNLQINQATVTNFELANNAVSTAKIQDEAVNGNKIAQMNALNGQVMKWNGTTWAPATDNVGTGDNWGNQVALVGSTISGNGVIGSPLNIAQQGATSGQVLKWNGTTWAPAADNDTGGDNWGTQTASTSVELEGDGTGGNPLRLADNGASAGQVLKFDGTLWVPGDDIDTGDDWGAQVTETSTELAGNGTAGNPLSIAQQGASNGQVLKWNGAAWTPADDDSGGDDWGVQVAVTNAELTGNGTAGSPLGIDQQGASTGQVLKWNGASWAPADDNDSGGDDWGAQAAATSLELEGDGTGGNPLRLADNSAAVGQVLKFDGTLWLPADDNDSGPDDWGTQTAQVDATLKGNGTSGNELGLADQGASVGQVLKFDGANWLPANDDTGTGPSDNWGTQVAITNTTLEGDGTPGNPLGIAQQGATAGQILKWDGANWIPGDDNDSGGDDWGAQAALTSLELEGDGTAGDPLRLADNSAAVGQVLKFDGTLWLPEDDLTDVNNYAAGAGIDITGTAPNFTIGNTGDLDVTNELQTISLLGNDLTLSNGGGTVTLPPSNTYAAGTGIDITGTAPNFTIENTGDNDNDSANEIQIISLSAGGDSLILSNGGGSVALPAGGAGNNYTAGTGIDITGTAPNFTIENTGDNDNDATNELQEISLNGKILTISGTNTQVDFDTLVTNASLNLWQGIGLNIRNANSGNVGIGVDTPLAKLHIMGDGESLRLEGNEPGITFVNGTKPGASVQHTTGAFQLGTVDSSAIIFSTAGGKGLTVNGTTGNVGTRGINTSNASLKVMHDNTVGGLMIENTLGAFWEFRVDAGTGGMALYNSLLGGIPAGFFAPNGVYAPSDRRLKKDILGLSPVLNRVMKLEPVNYRYKQESASSKASVGFIAQDVNELFPELVGSVKADDGKEYMAVNYAGFSVLAIKAIQEQQRQIESLQKENNTLVDRLNALEAKVLNIEQTARASGEK